MSNQRPPNPYAAPAFLPTPAVQLTCPACHAENPPNLKFCRGCGGMLGGGATPWANAAAAAGPVPAGHAWGCPQCRAENAAHYKFCLGCGASRDSAPNPMGFERAASPRAFPVAALIAIAVVMLMMVGGGVAFFLLMH